MRQLFKATANEAVETMIDEVVKTHGVSRTTAKKLIVNALFYNCVQDEILGQVDFLVNSEEDE